MMKMTIMLIIEILIMMMMKTLTMTIIMVVIMNMKMATPKLRSMVMKTMPMIIITTIDIVIFCSIARDHYHDSNLAHKGGNVVDHCTSNGDVDFTIIIRMMMVMTYQNDGADYSRWGCSNMMTNHDGDDDEAL